jgi:hypothetical protein
VKDDRHPESGREMALVRLRRELAHHDGSGAPETPFSAAIREQLAQEDSAARLSGASAA